MATTSVSAMQLRLVGWRESLDLSRWELTQMLMITVCQRMDEKEKKEENGYKAFTMLISIIYIVQLLI